MGLTIRPIASAGVSQSFPSQMCIALCCFCICMAKQSLYAIKRLPFVHEGTRKRMPQVMQSHVI